MPRIPRGPQAGQVYHVINRGNGGAVVFHKDGDYLACLNLLAEAKHKYPVQLFGFCLMPNHFHLVLRPDGEQVLSVFMQWWLTSHVRRYHQHYGGTGHIWQGRFKSFLIQQDEHFLTVLRYVLRNPVRAGLAPQPAQWPWSSLRRTTFVDQWPVPAPPDWERWIEEPLLGRELRAVRTSVNRQAPFGSAEWQAEVAHATGLESTLRPRGRPRKPPEK